MSETTTQQTYAYKAEMKQLLHLIVHALYTNQEIFLRELISNASDALGKVRFRMLTDRNVHDADAPLKVEISADPEARTLVIEDTGIGMTRDDLVERIGTVASSGTLAFIEELKKSGKPLDGEIIGQFGVGFYAAFMVADEVTIDTHHADPDAEAWRWTSDGEGTFAIEPSDRTARGTRITLKLKEDAAEFAQEYRIRQIIQKYSNFVDYPIYLAGSQVNTVKALWRKPKGELPEEELTEFYKFVSNDYQEPLGHLHLQVEGTVAFRALLFIPSVAPPMFFRNEDEHGLHLYVSNVFIQDDAKGLLPDYLRFVRGVVDSEDLPLNVSREVTQNSPLMAKMRQILTSKILGMLEEWADQEPDKYRTFFQHFGSILKVGLTQDPGQKDRLVGLMRYPSTKTEKGERTGLAAYKERMAEGQKAIYYALGERRDELERNPNLEYFRRHDLEVLLLTDPVDVFTITAIDTYDELPLQSIEKADLDLDAEHEGDESALSGSDLDALLGTFRSALGDRVEDVRASKRLVDSAATLVVGEQGMDAQMERMMKMMNEGFTGAKKILEVNPSHPLLRNLSALLAAGNAERVERSALQLYEGALLLEGALQQPSDFVQRMTEMMVEATTQDDAA